MFHPVPFHNVVFLVCNILNLCNGVNSIEVILLVFVVSCLMNLEHTFRSNSKYSLFVFLLGYQQLFNPENPRVAYTLILISNHCHFKTCGLE